MQTQNTIGKEELDRGYSREEEYFFRQNQDLIERKRREFEQNKAALPRPDWMKCPKCGAQMKEVELAGIRIDQCGGCRGLYFDQGELEILMESKEHKGFFGALKRLFRPA